MIKSKAIRPWYNISFDYTFLAKNPQFNLNAFPVILVCITKKIYPGNPHLMLYQLVQKIK